MWKSYKEARSEKGEGAAANTTEHCCRNIYELSLQLPSKCLPAGAQVQHLLLNLFASAKSASHSETNKKSCLPVQTWAQFGKQSLFRNNAFSLGSGS